MKIPSPQFRAVRALPRLASSHFVAFLFAFLAAPGNPLFAGQAPEKMLLAASADGAVRGVTPSSDQVTVSRAPGPATPGIAVAIRPGKDAYPGINIKPEAAAWDLSAFGHVEARVVNTGAEPLSLSLRVDNAGDWRDDPWDAESTTIEPGASGAVTVVFGFSYGHKPGYALKPSAVVNLVLFAGKSDVGQSFRIKSVSAGGTPGEKPAVAPEAVRVKPAEGLLVGGREAIDPDRQVRSEGAKVEAEAEGGRQVLRISFPAAGGEAAAALKPAAGRWDLRDCLEARVRVRNAGPEAFSPRVRLESNGGPTDWATTAAALAPGAEAEVVVPFVSATVWTGKGTGNRFTNDAVSAVTFSAEGGGGRGDDGAGRGAARERVLRVESVRADAPPAPQVPEWLGRRPPVPGDWSRTFDDEFDGAAIDASKWDVHGENYYDKQSHFSRDNVIVAGGFARLRFEKKRGHPNDDPRRPETPYATGFLDTRGKWAQRYGYFESRMKLPTAPGLWPAFWMMPDRGPSAPPGKRQDTADGGMEFDVLEHLTRWGPFRYNIAMHWDGYGKDHRSVGSENIYVQPDKDGFITAGLLWGPGSLTYYGNGREVLRWEDPRVGSVPEGMMFTLPMGGWDNDALDDARLPDDLVIDYVRAWQRRDWSAQIPAGAPESKPQR